MDGYVLGLLAGISVGLVTVAIIKFRLRGKPMSAAEKALIRTERAHLLRRHGITPRVE